MPKNNDKEVSSRESIFLNEHFMSIGAIKEKQAVHG